MGFQFPIAFPESLRATAKARLPVTRSPRGGGAKVRGRLSVLAGTLLASMLVSCISDGPNRTGGEYLAGHGIILDNPLYKVRLQGFPVDTFWTTDAQPSHLDDSLLLAGRNAAFTAEPRFAFHITDIAMLDSLSGEAGSLRLSLSTPTWKNVGPWNDNGDAALRSLVDSARDSLAFAVYAWDLAAAGLSDGAWKDSVARRNRLFLSGEDTLAVLPDPAAIDTLFLRVRGAYDSDLNQLQARALPRLEERLLAGKGSKHMVHLRMVPLPASDSADSLPAMLRIGGNWAYGAGVGIPSLLFGREARADSLNGKNRLPAQDLGNGRRAVTYTLRYGGSRDDLVVPFQRGLHLAFDRGALLDSIDSALSRQGIRPAPRPAEGPSLAYFVPFAAISLPIRPAALEAGLPVQFRVYSGVDSVPEDTAGEAIRIDRIGLGKSIAAWTTRDVGQTDKIANQVRLSYDSVGSLRRAVLSFSRDSSLNDTVFLPVGGEGQISSRISGYGKNSVLIIRLTAGDTALTARSYLNIRSEGEKIGFRDAITGEAITDKLDSLVTRFVQPGDSAIRLRSTAGIQALLNRDPGASALRDFEFRPNPWAFNPKAVTSQGDTLAYAVRIPVLSVITPGFEPGNPKVDLELYLYPLGAR